MLPTPLTEIFIVNNTRHDDFTRQHNDLHIEIGLKENMTLIFMSVNFRHGGYVHFRGIRANLNFGKNSFRNKKIKRANVTKSYPIAYS